MKPGALVEGFATPVLGPPPGTRLFGMLGTFVAGALAGCELIDSGEMIRRGVVTWVAGVALAAPCGAAAARDVTLVRLLPVVLAGAGGGERAGGIRFGAGGGATSSPPGVVSVGTPGGSISP